MYVSVYRYICVYMYMYVYIYINMYIYSVLLGHFMYTQLWMCLFMHACVHVFGGGAPAGSSAIRNRRLGRRPWDEFRSCVCVYI